MNWTDITNGVFEFGGAVMTCFSIRAIVKDKEVKGFSPLPTLFFTVWGVWNACWFYPSLHQWVSYAGGVAITLTNLAYLSLVYRYTRTN